MHMREKKKTLIRIFQIIIYIYIYIYINNKISKCTYNYKINIQNFNKQLIKNNSNNNDDNKIIMIIKILIN